MRRPIASRASVIYAKWPPDLASPSSPKIHDNTVMFIGSRADGEGPLYCKICHAPRRSRPFAVTKFLRLTQDRRFTEAPLHQCVKSPPPKLTNPISSGV